VLGLIGLVLALGCRAYGQLNALTASTSPQACPRTCLAASHPSRPARRPLRCAGRPGGGHWNMCGTPVA